AARVPDPGNQRALLLRRQVAPHQRRGGVGLHGAGADGTHVGPVRRAAEESQSEESRAPRLTLRTEKCNTSKGITQEDLQELPRRPAQGRRAHHLLGPPAQAAPGLTGESRPWHVSRASTFPTRSTWALRSPTSSASAARAR